MTRGVRPFELVLAWFHATLLLLLLTAGQGVPHRAALAAVSGAVIAVALVLLPWLGRGHPGRGAVVRAVAAAVLIPVSFALLGHYLPAIHSEPFEWVVAAQDVALLGQDAWWWSRPCLDWPLLIELLHLVYAVFYFIPVSISFELLRARRWPELEECVTLIAFAFFFSYLGYFLFPASSPYLFVDAVLPIRGLGVAPHLRATLDQLEGIKQDCVPSGHVMLSLCCLVLARRWRLRCFWPLVPVVALLWVSTVVLHFHYLVDTLYGAALVAPTLWLGARIARG